MNKAQGVEPTAGAKLWTLVGWESQMSTNILQQ